MPGILCCKILSTHGHNLLSVSDFLRELNPKHRQSIASNHGWSVPCKRLQAWTKITVTPLYPCELRFSSADKSKTFLAIYRPSLGTTQENCPWPVSTFCTIPACKARIPSVSPSISIPLFISIEIFVRGEKSTCTFFVLRKNTRYC